MLFLHLTRCFNIINFVIHIYDNIKSHELIVI